MRAIVAVLVCVAALHAALWAVLRDRRDAPDFRGILPSVSYAPFEGTAHPDVDNIPTAERIRSDLKTLSRFTRAIRLYSSTGGVELVPPIANEFGLKVTVGAWIEPNEKDGKLSQRSKDEIQAAVKLAKHNSNVIAVVVGNETIYRGEQKVDDLIELIQQVKKQVNVPVTTGEIWNIWRDNRKLAYAVDFIAAHVLPYWENYTAQQAVEQAMYRYGLLRENFPGKKVMIAEFGWPSAGYNLGVAIPGQFEQAVTLRNFVVQAQAVGMDYNIVEAIDQPWKFFEGGVGPYWGILNASREPKFAWTGAVEDPDYWKLAAIAILVGLLLSLPILRLNHPRVLQAAVLAATANGVGAWASTVFAYWNTHYFVFGSAFALSLGIILLIPLVIIAMARVEEIATVAFGRPPQRLIVDGLPAPADGVFPKVSIHIPAYFEPPEMLKQTLDAVARLDYPNLECVVIINNTPDPAFWQPIQDHCRMLGERFVFINAEKVQGFKAGALRIAMARTAPDAEIIGVIDADYVVTPDWLKELVPSFSDPRVGLVQAPQDHRDGGQSLMHYMMNGEYAGFFDIGMVQRNEEDAIIVHGTMCLIRRAAMDMAGGWAGDTICEDTDLGLAIIEKGWTTLYTNKRYGFGLLPDTYEAFRKQRHRWAYGGFQIVKKHWRRFLPGATRLTPDQKRQFAVGWLNWLGAESIGVLVAILNLLWTPVVAFAGIAIPDRILTLPIVVSFLVSALHFLALYRLRVRIPVGQMLGAMLTAMSVQWTVSRAVAQGLITEHLAFARTSKGGLSRMSVEFQAFWEAVICVLLWVGAAVLVFTNSQKQITEIYIFAGVLVLQSLPFFAAVAIALLENSRINAFTFWRETGIRTAELIGLRPVALPLPGSIAQPTTVAAEISSDAP